MNIISWNVCGLNARSRRVLYEHCRSYSPMLLGIIEPKAKFSRICASFWKSINLIPIHQNTRVNRCSNIWVFAAPGVDITVALSSEQLVVIDMKLQGKDVRVAFVHGSNSYVVRRSLWHDLTHSLSPNCVYIGDFNALLGAHERRGNAPAEISCREFRLFIESAELIEPASSGVPLTWAGRRFLPRHTESVLDRALMSFGFSEIWFSSTCLKLPRITSDHSPIVLSCSLDSINSPKPFRFSHMWIMHEDFLRVISSSWSEQSSEKCPIFRVMAKLRRLKTVLKSWNKNVFGNVDVQIATLQDKLIAVQQNIGTNGYSDRLFDEEVCLQADLDSLLNKKKYAC